MQAISFQPIGIVHSGHLQPEGTPIQFLGAKEFKGEIEIFAEFKEGLADLDGFSHLMLIYYFHQIKNVSLSVKPFMDEAAHGVFATRSPARPNPIGFSIVRLLEIRGTRLLIEGLDMLNETPLLDLKPYVPHFDAVDAEKIGWLEANIEKHWKTKDDGRFIT